MWPQPPPTSTTQGRNNISPEASWEDLLDSGVLDHQLNTLSVSTRPMVPVQPYYSSHFQHHSFDVPPPTMSPYHSHPHHAPYTQHPLPPTMFTQPPPVPLMQQPPPQSMRPPPMILQRPQTSPQFQTTFLQQQKRLPNSSSSNNSGRYFNGPSNTRPSNVRSPYNVPPPPVHSASSSNINLNDDDDLPSNVSKPTQQIQVISDNEHGSHTPYQPPEPKLKILKRPQSSPSNLSAQGANSNAGERNKPKSLKQREEEYAQARLRILGSAASPEEVPDESAEEELKNNNDKSKPVVINSGNNNAASKSCIRLPKGPDGTKGFHKQNEK